MSQGQGKAIVAIQRIIRSFTVKDFQPAVVRNPQNTSREEELVVRAVQGDARAFGALYSLYYDAVYRYVYFRTGNVIVAEDLTENVFLKAWRAIGSSARGRLRFSSWLYRIARNVVVDHYRTRRDDVRVGTGHLRLAEEEHLGPEALTLRREEVKELQRAIARLPEEQQQVIVLRFIEGLTHAEVSEILGKTEEACRVIQYRGLKVLSRLLGGEK